MMITAGFLLAVGCLGMVIFKQQGILSVFTVIFGLGYGAVWPIYAAAIPDYFSGNRTGLILSLWGLLLGIGSIASPVISGWVIDTSGSFPLAFAIASGTAVGSLILLFTVGQPARFKDE
jgi:MFS family permease